ncbi:MAG: hypothetical protein ACFE7R_04465 [Candidatus Hodarchaeota archaeon]
MTSQPGTLRFIETHSSIPIDGKYYLKDLAGSGGRVDVLCRSLSACYDWAPSPLSSMEIKFIAILNAEIVLWFSNPSAELPIGERAWAEVIQDSLQGHPPEFVKVHQWNIEKLVEEILKEEASYIWALVQERIPFDRMESFDPRAQNSFMLGDHQGFDADTQQVIRDYGIAQVSLGDISYLSSHCVATIISRLERMVG